AGMTLSGLIREAAAHNLGGLEFLAGIPASVGGAVLVNAGTRDGSLADICTAVYFLYPDGTMGEHRPVPHMSGAFDLPASAIVVGLMDMTRQRVEKQFGITLSPEIRMLGFSGSADGAEPAELIATRAS